MNSNSITCQHPSPYSILFYPQLKQLMAALPELLDPFEQCILIADEHVASLHAAHLASRLSVNLITIPAGEQAKSRDQKAKLEETLIHLGVTRHVLIIAMGGGVVLDLVNYVSATLLRGLACINIPTTLLAMVDASVGGKNGINLPQGKNLLGTIRAPNHVLICPDYVHTLSKENIKNGQAEMLKHSLLAGDLFSGKLYDQIYANVAFKAQIVERDPYEQADRIQLNLGHTIAHALEQIWHYEISHGEAVAWGLLIESKIAMTLRVMQEACFKMIESRLAGLDLCEAKWVECLDIVQLVEAMRLDKKRLANGTIRFVLLVQPGKYVVKDVGELQCIAMLEEILK